MIKQWTERANQLKTDIPAVFIALKNKDTPLMAKLLAWVVIVYALSPIDLIPDFIPILGYLDDLIILPGLIMIIIKLIPPETMEQCRIEAAGQSRMGKKWVYAWPFLLIWIMIATLIIKMLTGGSYG